MQNIRRCFRKSVSYPQLHVINVQITSNTAHGYEITNISIILIRSKSETIILGNFNLDMIRYLSLIDQGLS